VLYLALDKKSATGWDTVEAMFAALLAGESSYYVGRSQKGGFWRYWGTKKAAVGKKGASGYAQQTVVGIMQSGTCACVLLSICVSGVTCLITAISLLRIA
jgi:hypothetical protein